jgi:hypothetical protein
MVLHTTGAMTAATGPTSNGATAAEILAALRCAVPACLCNRPRTRVGHCPASAHQDRNPSLGVDERAGRTLFFCRAGCRQDEVLRALRERGLWASPARRPRSRPAWRSPLAAARDRVLAEAKRERWARPGAIEMYRAADAVRTGLLASARLRQAATTAGDREEIWDLLDRAAEIEREAFGLEAELDAEALV